MKILIIGSSGMLGHVLTLYLIDRGYDVEDISATTKWKDNTKLINVNEEISIKTYLNNNKFDIVINCAALLVKESEKNKIGAIKLNSLFPHWLEDFYSTVSTQVIQVSTAGVYYGDKSFYSEEARHDTVNFYGKTKSLGELNNSKDLTIRSDFFGPDMNESGVGLFNWAMSNNDKVNGYNKVFINGVTSLEFAKFVDYIINNPIAGTVNLHSKEIISKADLLRKIYSIMKKDVQVIDNPSIERNTCVKSIRKDCFYIQKSYDQQLHELLQWISNHKELYGHYYKDWRKNEL